MKHWQIFIIFGMQHCEKLDVNDFSLAHCTLILLLHYLVKYDRVDLGYLCRLRIQNCLNSHVFVRLQHCG